MFYRIFAVLCLCAAALTGGLLVSSARAQEDGRGYTFSGPITHENLAVFLVHGPDAIKGHAYLSLQEALEQKKLIVYETSSVNELKVENLSPTEDVFIQAGEIVKGGKQDRTFGVDMIVQAKSGQVPIAAYCVENGRWTQRGAEDAGQFNSSSSALPTNDLRLAATFVPDSNTVQGIPDTTGVPANGQSAVWKSVAQEQAKLSNNVGSDVAAKASATSLQLSLEDQRLRQMVAEYVKQIVPAVRDKTDVIGYAVAVNGKVRSVDVYASNALFLKLWPKMIDAASIQAVAELEKGRKVQAVTADQVKQFMAATTNGKESSRDVTGRVNMLQRDSQGVVQFETRDLQQPGAGGGAGGGRGGAVHSGWVGK